MAKKCFEGYVNRLRSDWRVPEVSSTSCPLGFDISASKRWKLLCQIPKTSKKLSELFSSFTQFIGQMTTSVQGSSVGRDTGSRARALRRLHDASINESIAREFEQSTSVEGEAFPPTMLELCSFTNNRRRTSSNLFAQFYLWTAPPPQSQAPG